MKTIRTSLAIILIIYSFPAFLSGLDIYKGTEPDLSSEWIILCIFFVLSLLLFILDLLGSMRRDHPQHDK
jgi:membrane protease YdiL (CAAX protease family)